MKGFGTTTEQYKPSAWPEKILRHVETKYVTNGDCKCPSRNKCATGHPNYLIDNMMMCTNLEGKNACRNDSGGPLYDKNRKVLVGVTSWGT